MADVIHSGTSTTLAAKPKAECSNTDIAYIWLERFNRKMVFDSTATDTTVIAGNGPYYIRPDDYGAGPGVWIEEVGADQPEHWSGNQLVTGLITSTNWAAALGSQFDLDAGVLKLGGSNAPALGDSGITMGIGADIFLSSATGTGDSNRAYLKFILDSFNIKIGGDFDNNALIFSPSIAGSGQVRIGTPWGAPAEYPFSLVGIAASNEAYLNVKNPAETAAAIITAERIGEEHVVIDLSVDSVSHSATLRLTADEGGGIGNAYFDNDLLVYGDVWIQTECSALSFDDRTPFYSGDALIEIKKIKGDGKGGIDHKTLPEFAQRTIVHKRRDPKTNEVFEIQEPGRSIGAMVSVLTVAIQQLSQRIEGLEQ